MTCWMCFLILKRTFFIPKFIFAIKAELTSKKESNPSNLYLMPSPINVKIEKKWFVFPKKQRFCLLFYFCFEFYLNHWVCFSILITLCFFSEMAFFAVNFNNWKRKQISRTWVMKTKIMFWNFISNFCSVEIEFSDWKYQQNFQKILNKICNKNIQNTWSSKGCFFSFARTSLLNWLFCCHKHSSFCILFQQKKLFFFGELWKKTLVVSV